MRNSMVGHGSYIDRHRQSMSEKRCRCVHLLDPCKDSWNNPDFFERIPVRLDSELRACASSDEVVACRIKTLLCLLFEIQEIRELKTILSFWRNQRASISRTDCIYLLSSRDQLLQFTE